MSTKKPCDNMIDDAIFIGGERRMHVNYKVYSKDINITDAMREYLDKKLSKVFKAVSEDKVISMDVRISKERAFFRIEVTSHLPGVMLRVEEKGSDFYGVVDTLSDAFERRLKRYKDRAKFKHKVSTREIAESFSSEEHEEESHAIQRKKRFNIKPMTVDEALLQMEMLGHTFFVFRNVDTDEVNVLYTRRNGSVGLIEMSE